MKAVKLSGFLKTFASIKRICLKGRIRSLISFLISCSAALPHSLSCHYPFLGVFTIRHLDAGKISGFNIKLRWPDGKAIRRAQSTAEKNYEISRNIS